MGGCLSSPAADGAAPPRSKPSSRPAARAASRASSRQASVAAAKKPEGPPDFGLADDWEVLKLLGTGGEGETWLCREKATDREVAIKLVRRPIPKTITQIINREVKILAELGDGCLNIVKAEEVLLSRSHFGLVMEYVQGGNMVAYVTKRRAVRTKAGLCLDEDEACYLFRQLIWAVLYCHERHVAHRDLKLDNALLDGRNPPRLKLCDFGFAKGWGATSNMDTMRIGTPEYMGPELITGRMGYDGQKVDVWAAGVMLFVMLLGSFPFEMDDENYETTAGLYSMWVNQVRTSWQENPHNTNAASGLSADCRDLLDKMFDVNQDSRISFEGVARHPWFNRALPPRYKAALDELQRDQAALTARQAAHPANNLQTRERDMALQSLMDRASRQPAPGEALSRIALLQTGPAAGAAGSGGGDVMNGVDLGGFGAPMAAIVERDPSASGGGANSAGGAAPAAAPVAPA